MCYSIGSGVGWGTLALLSQSDLDLNLDLDLGYPNQHLTQWNNTPKPVHTPTVYRVRLELLKMGVARNM
jgi:hypothetical protein